MRRILAFFSGVVMGGLAGAALALLLTPSSGDQIRGDIQSRYIELRDEVQHAAAARRQELETQLQELRKPPQTSS